jgi:hypothetical protein
MIFGAFVSEKGPCYVSLDSLELLGSCSNPVSASPVAWSTGMCHVTRLQLIIILS